MLRNVADHLENLRYALSSVNINVKNNHTEDILIDERTYSSSVVLRTVEEMSKTVIRFEEKLLQFAGQNVSNIIFFNEHIRIKGFNITILFYRKRNPLKNFRYGGNCFFSERSVQVAHLSSNIME